MTRDTASTMWLRRRVSLLVVALVASVLAAPPTADAQQTASLITVGVDVTDATLGQATYSLFVANRGNAIARGVELTNSPPTNTRFSASDRAPLAPAAAGAPCVAGAPPATVCRWALGDLPPGAGQTVSVSYALELSESGYGAVHSYSNSASAQAAGDAGAVSDQDRSLVRTSHVLTDDAHVDDAAATQNFGACDQLRVRRDNGLTAFAESDVFAQNSYPFAEAAVGTSGPGGVESLWHGEVRATAASIPLTSTGAQISIHAVTSGEWAEGSGSCAGAAGTGNQARGAAQPESHDSPTAVASLDAPGPVAWDVRAAMDTRDERLAFNGFEFRAVPTTGASAADVIAFHSSEATSDGIKPRLVTLATRSELDRCIDSDPETGAMRADGEQRIDAYVTDAAGGRVSNAGGDACSGSPVEGAPVGWELDDDEPDAYVSSLGGAAEPRETGSTGDAGPDERSTRTGPTGQTFIGVRLGNPYASDANEGENRIGAISLNQHHDGALSPTTGMTSGSCEPGEMESSFGGVPRACSATGEAATEDDVHVTWSTAPPPAPPAPPTESGTAGGGAGPAAPQPEGPAARTVALEPSTGRAAVGDTVRLTGQVASPVAACTGPRELVEVLRRRRGTSTFTEFASVSTVADGRFELPMLVDASADYVASAPARPGCANAASGASTVLARRKVFAYVARPATSRRGRRLAIRGRVLPALTGSVVLERRVGRRWRTVARRRLSRRGTFGFPLRSSWRGARDFRVAWRSSAGGYLGGVSRTLSVRSGR